MVAKTELEPEPRAPIRVGPDNANAPFHEAALEPDRRPDGLASVIRNPSRDFIRVDASAIHGTGVFAKRGIPRGTRVIAYAGERTTRARLVAEARTLGRDLTYVLNVDEDHVIDGLVGGNEARFVNHACAPNCEIYVFEDVPYLYAREDIPLGAELTFDYQLRSMESERLSLRLARERYPCNCGSSLCRGTLLSSEAIRPRHYRYKGGARPNTSEEES